MLRAELVKARTTKTALALVIGAAVAVALGTASMVLSQPAEHMTRSLHDQQFFFIASIAISAFAAVLGVRAFTDEFRYGSIVPTFLLEPRRGRVLLWKVVSTASIGAVMGVVAQVAMIGVGFALAATRGVQPAIGGTDLQAMLALAAAAALWAALGVGIGAAVRHQIAAIVGVIVWLIAIENIAAGMAGDVALFLPGRAAQALADATAAGDILPQPTGAVVLLAYTGVVALLGLVSLQRDVEAA